MSDTIYRVITDYTVQDHSSGPMGSIAKAAMGVAGALGVAIGAKTLWDQLVSGPQDTPTSVVTMAALINANQTYVDSAGKAVSAAQNFASSQGTAKTMVDQMVEASKTAAGGLKDFISIGVDTINSFTQAGGQLGKPFVAFDKQVLTTAGLLGEDFKQAGMDAMRILTGGAGMDVRLFAAIRPQIFALSKDLSKLPIDKATEKFNKMASPERLKLFQKAMGKFATPEAVGAISATMPAQLSTLTDNVTALRNAFAGAFSDRVLGTLAKINGWFETNGTAIEATARRWGDVLAGAFDRGVSAVMFIKDHMAQILPVLGVVGAFGAVAFGKWAIALAPILGGGLLRALGPVGTFLKGGMETFSMFRTMGAGLGQSLWGALTFGFSPIAIGLGAGIALLGLFAGYVLSSAERTQAMALAFAPVTAAIEVATEALGIAGGYIETALTPIMNACGLAGQTAFGWVTQAVGYTATGVLLLVAGVQTLGATIAGVVMKGVSYFQFLRDTISDVMTALSTFSLAGVLKDPIGSAKAAANVISGAAGNQMAALAARNSGIDTAVGAEQRAIGDRAVGAMAKAMGAAGSGRGRGASARGVAANAVPQKHTTNIHGGVKIVMNIEKNEEPDRIAFHTKALFDNAARNPTTAKSVPRFA